MRANPPGCSVELLQLGVLRLGLVQDRDVGVGVFPEREEIPIRGAGLTVVTLHRIRTRDAQTGKSAYKVVERYAALLNDLLELGCRGATLVGGQIGLPSRIDGIEVSEGEVAQFVGSRGLKGPDGLRRIAAVKRELSPKRRQVVKLHDSIFREALR